MNMKLFFGKWSAYSCGETPPAPPRKYGLSSENDDAAKVCPSALPGRRLNFNSRAAPLCRSTYDALSANLTGLMQEHVAQLPKPTAEMDADWSQATVRCQ